MLWVDDCLICSPEHVVVKKANKFLRLFDATNETPDGDVTEYVGYKIEQNNEKIRMTQPTKIQQFINKFRYGKKKKIHQQCRVVF